MCSLKGDVIKFMIVLTSTLFELLPEMLFAGCFGLKLLLEFKRCSHYRVLGFQSKLLESCFGDFERSFLTQAEKLICLDFDRILNLNSELCAILNLSRLFSQKKIIFLKSWNIYLTFFLKIF